MYLNKSEPTSKGMDSMYSIALVLAIDFSILYLRFFVKLLEQNLKIDWI